MRTEHTVYRLPEEPAQRPRGAKQPCLLNDEGPSASAAKQAHIGPIDSHRREPNVYKSDYPNDAQRQLHNDGAGVTGLVERFAVPVIVTAAHVAVYFVAALTGPAPELIRVIP